MQAGDRLVAVAGESVEGLGHEETVSKIRAQGSRVSLIVVDPKADRFFSMVRAEAVVLEGARDPTETPPSWRAEGLLFLHGLESNPGSSLQTEEEAGLP